MGYFPVYFQGYRILVPPPPYTSLTSRRVLRGVRSKMALIFSPNNQNITCKDVLIT